ncbi:GNAT family N-acetyltransferase [Rhodococcus aetherivorans]|uniref:GNAT family N-acetyltransferase n=1 Tax=Rhodococcus aetherivorans TaxID=191292 RepID=UPI00045CDF88|nr:N-acetyltransferase [Rhodococcus aetherivorans]KDE11982.1 acetyltransferase [Rhodococcus aetherivorans]
MFIRRELPADVPAIGDVHRAAFAPLTPTGAEPVEPGLVEALRAGPAWLPRLSLVATDAEGTVVGHVCVTRGTVDGEPALALGPIGVLPELQRAGVGGALMHAVLGAADALDEPLVVLLGHLDYYPRFGFVPAAELGVEPDVPEWASHLQARALTAHRPQLRGVFRYAPPFYEIG